ncbi:hypothetical protein K501DRAFT_101510 [Backusella circina FSU 941]|nr:hypothetical protein K501DRAFT_101510 [Backusella circina FSU 941]
MNYLFNHFRFHTSFLFSFCRLFHLFIIRIQFLISTRLFILVKFNLFTQSDFLFI